MQFLLNTQYLIETMEVLKRRNLTPDNIIKQVVSKGRIKTIGNLRRSYGMDLRDALVVANFLFNNNKQSSTT